MFLSHIFLSQIPSAPGGSIENWLLPAAAVASMALVAKQLFQKKRHTDTFVTRADLNHELTAIRDKIDARFLALSEKIDRLAERLTTIESAIARLDERSRK